MWYFSVWFKVIEKYEEKFFTCHLTRFSILEQKQSNTIQMWYLPCEYSVLPIHVLISLFNDA